MSDKQGEIDFVASRFSGRTAEIKKACNNADFRELCEHLALMCRLEAEATGAERVRFTALRSSLDEELLEWLGRFPFNTHKREQD